MKRSIKKQRKAQKQNKTKANKIKSNNMDEKQGAQCKLSRQSSILTHFEPFD